MGIYLPFEGYHARSMHVVAVNGSLHLAGVAVIEKLLCSYFVDYSTNQAIQS